MDEKHPVSFLHFVMLVCMLAIRTRIRGRLLHVQLSASADVMLGSVLFCFILSIMKCLSHSLISVLLYQLINV